MPLVVKLSAPLLSGHGRWPPPAASGWERIQWSVIIMPWVASLRGMWQPTQPVAGETLQEVREGPSWQDRHTASYAGRSVEVRACGSWQVAHDKAPGLFR